MFSGFYIDLDKSFFSSKQWTCYRKIGITHLHEAKRKYDDSLERYKKEKGLSASLIEQDWFPEIEADVFISHSRDDEELVEAFAGWLNKTYGLRCFLDSHVWNHANELIFLLDQQYSNPVTEDNVTYYSYKESNKVCEHANMMLAVALQKMIDRTESLFFVNAGNAAHLVNGNIINETYSPWIYAELACANIVRKKPLIAYRSYDNQLIQKRKKDANALFECIQISYPINLRELYRLDAETLHAWERCKNQSDFKYPLDALYEITCYQSDLRKAKRISKGLTETQLEQIQKFYSSEAKEQHRELQALMESVEEKLQFDFCECPLYGGCKYYCCHRGVCERISVN